MFSCLCTRYLCIESILLENGYEEVLMETRTQIFLNTLLVIDLDQN